MGFFLLSNCYMCLDSVNTTGGVSDLLSLRLSVNDDYSVHVPSRCCPCVPVELESTSLRVRPHLSDRLQEEMVILAFSVLSSDNEKLL